MLKGKTALVTGGSRGIGRAIALKLAENGADVAIVYAGRQDAAEETRRDIEALGVKAAAYQCDAADFDAVKAVVAAVGKELGGVDILVNNAGRDPGRPGVLHEGGGLRQGGGHQLEGLLQLHQALLPRLRAQAGGEDPQHQLGLRHHGQRGAGQLFRLQGGGHRPDQGGGPGAGRAGDSAATPSPPASSRPT